LPIAVVNGTSLACDPGDEMATMASDETVSYQGYRPGALGRICRLQAEYYAREWGFGRAFETKVAAEMAEFLDRADAERDLFLTARRAGEIIAGITLDVTEGDDGLAHLRWFIAADAARGTGVGRELLTRAVAHGRRVGCRGIYLWTFAGLDAAAALYRGAGFELTESLAGETWGTEVTEQRFDLIFTD
jgi:GNAT superfamily N-acetyltransferase